LCGLFCPSTPESSSKCGHRSIGPATPRAQGSALCSFGSSPGSKIIFWLLSPSFSDVDSLGLALSSRLSVCPGDPDEALCSQQSAPDAAFCLERRDQSYAPLALRSLGSWWLKIIGCWIVALRSVPCPLASGSAQCPRPLAIKNNCVVDCCIAWPLDLGSRCIVWPVSIKILWWIVASLGSLQLRVRPWF